MRTILTIVSAVMTVLLAAWAPAPGKDAEATWHPEAEVAFHQEHQAPAEAAVPPPPIYMAEEIRPLPQPSERTEQLAWERFLGPEIGKEAYRIAEQHGLPHHLVRRLIQVESGGDPDATSHTSDRGLMQLNDSTWPWLSRRLGIAEPDPYDPTQNLEMGMHWLAALYAKYTDWDMALTAYNRGEAGLQEHMARTGTARSGYSDRVLRWQNGAGAERAPAVAAGTP